MKNIEYEIFSLPEKEVKILDKYKTWEDFIIIEIKWKIIKHKCPKCWWYNTKRVWKWYEIQIVNHMFLSNYKVIKLKIYKRRFMCMDCDKKENNFIERFSFLWENCKYTEPYKAYIMREREYSSLKELSRKFRVSESMVYDVINNLSIDKLLDEKIEYMNSLKEIYLWVDEVSYRWKDFVTTITELKQGKVLWVLETRSKKDLIRWLSRIWVETLKKIKWIATDMNATYKRTIQEYISKETWVKLEEIWAKWVADHFHIKQMMNKLVVGVNSMNKWMIKAWHYWDELVNLCEEEIINKQKYRTDKLKWTIEYHSDNIDYKAITLWFFLSKRYHSLMTMKKANLTEKQYDRLMQIFAEFDPCWYVYQAWKWKEMLMKSIKDKDIWIIDKLIIYFRKSVHYKVKTVWKTIKKRREEIKNYFEIKITNAFTEWKNTKAKLFKRMAYWYYKKENYIKRLLLCL